MFQWGYTPIQEITRIVEKELSDREKSKPKLSKWVDVALIVTALVAVAGLVLSILNFQNQKEYDRNSINLTNTHNQKAIEPALSYILNENPNDPLWDFLGIAFENNGLGPA